MAKEEHFLGRVEKLKERIFYYALGSSLLATIPIVLDSGHYILLLVHAKSLQGVAQAILFT